MNEYIQALERVAKISAQIYKVTSLAFASTKQICCPHGNCPSYPAHAWWCDQCWFELKDALENLEFFQQDTQADGHYCVCTLDELSNWTTATPDYTCVRCRKPRS